MEKNKPTLKKQHKTVLKVAPLGLNAYIWEIKNTKAS